MGEEPAGISDEVVIFLAWLRIQEHEAAHPDQPYATALDLRSPQGIPHGRSPLDLASEGDGLQLCGFLDLLRHPQVDGGCSRKGGNFLDKCSMNKVEATPA